MIISISLIPSNLHADDKALELCLDAYSTCELQVETQRKLNREQDELIMKLVKQRNEAFEKLGNEESKAPWYLWALGGVAVGLIVGQTVVFK